MIRTIVRDATAPNVGDREKTMDIRDILIIDFEASGLGPGSWPIEVGLAWVADETVRSWSSLIRPEPGWEEEAWDPASENVHGIPREALETAPSAWSVADKLLGMVGDRSVFSDAPDFDGKWARRLLDAQPSTARLAILDLDQAIVAACGERGADWAYERLERTRTPHRAGPDAERMLEAILHGRRRENGPTGTGECSP